MSDSKTVTATFKNRSAAEVAVAELYKQGASQSDISVLMTDSTHGREFQLEENSKAAEGMGVGAVTGGALGALAAGLTAFGAVASGGAILAAGPLVAAAAGAGAGGTAGGLIGALVGLGIPEHEAKLSEKDVEAGNILVGVNVLKDRVDSVKDVLKDTGANNIHTQ